MAGFGTGFSGTFAPTARLGLIDRQLDMNEQEAANMSPAIVQGMQKPILSNAGGGAAIPAPATATQKRVAQGGGGAATPQAPAIEEKDGWTTLMEEKALLQTREFEEAQQALMFGDGSLLSKYTDTYGNQDVKFDFNVKDDGSIHVQPMKQGKASGKGTVFSDFEKFYTQFGARFKPRVQGLNTRMNTETYLPEGVAVGNEKTGYAIADPAGVNKPQKVLDAMSPELGRALNPVSGGSGTNPATIKASDMVDNIRGLETKRSSMMAGEGVAPGVLQPALNDALMDTTWGIRDYGYALTKQYPDVAKKHGYTTLVPADHVKAMLPLAEKAKGLAPNSPEAMALKDQIDAQLEAYQNAYSKEAANELYLAMFEDYSQKKRGNKKNRRGK